MRKRRQGIIEASEMTQLDDLLARLGNVAVDPRLAMMDAAVLAGMERARQPVLSARALAGLAAVALVSGGVVSGVMPDAHPRHGEADPLELGGELAPSTLLDRAL